MKKLVVNVITDEVAIFDEAEIENLIKNQTRFHRWQNNRP
jgi:hypothetical protein